jgi:Raf kinase inhibitor-like YbhB/YbcL family protein
MLRSGPSFHPDVTAMKKITPKRRMSSFLLLAACASIVCATSLAAAGASLQITSSAFPPNGPIPSKYTCDGQSVTPPLAFSSVPARTQSLVLIVDDPDVPKSLMPSGVFDHWLVWDLPGDSKGLAEGAGKSGINGTGQQGYIGPCPPDREHRYFFKLYALDTKITGAKIANKTDLEKAMEGHIIEKAELVGRYERTAGK